MFNIITNEQGSVGGTSFIGYYPKYLSPELINKVKQYCSSQTEWRGGMSSFGKPIPRLQRWYQTEGRYFSPTWRGKYPRWEPFSYDDSLLEIQEQVNEMTNELVAPLDDLAMPTFNSCLINYYRDNQDSIKPHSDSVTVFGNQPTIAIISIGASRDIYFKRKDITNNNGDGGDKKSSLKLDQINKHLNGKITLEEGSLLVMSGDTQYHYLHEIPKVDEDKGERYSLTFREYQT